MIRWHLFDDGWSQRIALVVHLITYVVFFCLTIRDLQVYSWDNSYVLICMLIWMFFLILHFSGYFYRRGRDSKFKLAGANRSYRRRGFVLVCDMRKSSRSTGRSIS